MAYGARIRNEGGSLVQIDPLYENLALRDKGSVVTVQLGASGRESFCGIATIQMAGCNEPLIAVKCDGVFVALRKRTKSGTTYTWELITSTPVTTVQYWVFDTTDVAQMAFAIPHGMRVRNPNNGRVVFDSRYKYMRILSMISGTVASIANDYAVPISSGFAVAFSNPSLSTLVAGGPVSDPNRFFYQVQTQLAGFRTGSGVVSTMAIVTRSFTLEGANPPPYPTGVYGSLQARGLCLDVRNY
ncbi:hypothetical protein [uncultured Stenotrophomonas sp.]|uniref:hypothetical protein n=1 Tax=uncultured Stenotrophomonas sp. TaxID=165438 RepID=UPI0025F3DF7A|nr:hypothetical protein [uncultured Stenotrophomonas sp.]